jgi:hypothetical protein
MEQEKTAQQSEKTEKQNNFESKNKEKEKEKTTKTAEKPNDEQTEKSAQQSNKSTVDTSKFDELEQKIKKLEQENLTAKQSLALEKVLRGLEFSSSRSEKFVKQELQNLEFDGEKFKEIEKKIAEIQKDSPEFFKPDKTDNIGFAMGKTNGTGNISTLSEQINSGFKK